jgi:putative flippase GtrA
LLKRFSGATDIEASMEPGDPLSGVPPRAQAPVRGQVRVGSPLALTARAAALAGAAGVALRRGDNWAQLGKFCAVGASGYVVNLVVFKVLLDGGLHYLPAATCSFAVAVTNNYAWNRLWTFRGQRGAVAPQGVRFLAVSTVALAANLAFLSAMVALGIPEFPAQAVAIALVAPWSFTANKLWSFRTREPR